MFKSPGLVGRVGSGISSLASVLGGGAAAATTYLLQALFGGANQALANTDVLTDEKGDLTVVDTSTGTVKIASSTLEVDGIASWNATGWTGPGITSATGKKFICAGGTWTPVNGGGTIFALNSSAQLETSPQTTFEASACSFLSSSTYYFTTRDKVQWPSSTTGVHSFTNTGKIDYAIAQDSDKYLSFWSTDSGTTWNLGWVGLTTTPPATVYPVLQAYNDLYQATSLIIPTAADTSVFTPAGYALDTFTDVNGTLLESHGLDSGGSWTVSEGSNNLKIQSNELVINSFTTDSTAAATVEAGYSDGFINANVVYRTAASGVYINQISYRYTDDANHWGVRLVSSFGTRTWELVETTVSTTLRASSAISLSNGSTAHLAARFSGDTHEAWLNGGNKLTYSSAVRNTATKHGLRITQTSTLVPSIKDWYVLPLTSATYNTAFDTSALTADDCDLYHTFDSIPDVTFANGAVIRDGYVDDGSLTVSDTGAGSVEVLSGRLKLTHDTTTTLGAASQAFTPVAGTVMRAGFLQTNTAGTAEFMTSSDGAFSGRTARFSPDSVNGMIYGTYNPAGTAESSFVSQSWSNGNQYAVAIVLGGYDSAGVPDATGTYGSTCYTKDVTGAGSWTLHSTYPSGLNQATTTYAFLSCYGGLGSTEFDDIYLPDSGTTVESVFTPTGYALDTFTDTNGTTLPGHTGETSESWSDIDLSLQTFTIQSNAAHANGSAAAYFDSGLSDLFLNATLGAATSGFSLIYYRMATGGTPVNDNWAAVTNRGATEFSIYEYTGGSPAVRATASVTNAAGDVISVRASGTSHEVWHNGSTKLSYTSSVKQTETGVGIRGNSIPNTTIVDDIYVLPLTSATYTDLDF